MNIKFKIPKYLPLLVLLQLTCSGSMAQEINPGTKGAAKELYNPLEESSRLNAVCLPGSEPQMYRFKPEAGISHANIFSSFKDAWGLSASDEMRITRTEATDELGVEHFLFQQYYNGVKVEGAEFRVHQREGIAESANGFLYKFDNAVINTTPSISKMQAFMVAAEGKLPREIIQTIDAQKLDEHLNKKVELVLTQLDLSTPMSTSNVVCAYKVKLRGEVTYVNAITGVMIRKNALYRNCSAGSCVTLYNGTKTFYTKWVSGHYETIYDCNGANLHVHDGFNDCWPNDDEEVDDDDNSWSLYSERKFTSSLWAGGLAWEYFRTVHGRYGMNNGNGRVDIRANTSFPTAFIKAGDGDWCWPFYTSNDNDMIWVANGSAHSVCNAALDIIGHEFTHGVIGYTSDLNNWGESSALNEGFADIFGTVIEFWGDAANADYIAGGQPASDDFFKRSLSNPNAFPVDGGPSGSPDTYNGTYWSSGNDGHVNGGVVRFWFYLLAEGGSGTNDLSNTYSVSALGRDKAAAISYRAITVYMTSSSNYSDARKCTIKAAEDLYGICSNEALQTAKAWYAVGVGPSTPLNIRHACGDYSGSNKVAAFDVLTAGANSSAGCSYTTIHTGSSTHFIAGNSIRLFPSFHAEAGSNFRALISTCAETAYKQAQNNQKDLLKGKNKTITTIPGASPLSTSAVNSDESRITISPNPSSGQFNIKFTTSEKDPVLISVTDVLGNIVFTGNKNTTGSEQINLSAYAKGTYIVKIQSASSTFIRKIVLQ